MGKSYIGEFEQMLLLAILRKGDDAYALEIRRELQDRAGRRVSRGAFYTTLDRMQAKGYLSWTTRPISDARGGRPQRHFEITEEGLAQLRRAHQALTNLWDGLDRYLARP